MTESFSMDVRSNLSVNHLLASARFSRHVCSIEKANQGKPLGPPYDEILSFCIATVLTSVASLESYANEIFFDYHRNFPEVREALVISLLDSISKMPILDKFDLALVMRNVEALDKGAGPYQDVDVLIKLRNALIHFSPEWESSQDLHAKLSAKLRGRFQASPFLQESAPLFPKRWASSGCAKWAVRSCLLFAEKFEAESGLEPRYKRFKDRLAVE